MGKMKGNIYRYYMLKLTNDPGARPKYECRFCSKQYVQNATKMRHHVLNMCEEIPAPLKLALLDIPNVNAQDDSIDEIQEILDSFGNSPDEGGERGTPSKQSVQSKKFPSTSSNTPTTTTTASPGSSIKVSGAPNKRKLSISGTPSTSHQFQSKILNMGDSSSLHMYTSTPSTNTMSSYFTQESVHVLLARAIFASGASLSLLENPYWKELFQRIAPEIPLPTKKELVKDLLEKEFVKIQQDVEKQISDAKYLSIQCESWFNNRQESMVTIGLNTPTPYSYKTFLTSSVNHHDPALIAEYTLQAIQEIGSSKVLSLVTSSSRHMRTAWEKIQEVHPNIIIFGCVIEALTKILMNILEHELIAELISVLKNVCIKLKKSTSVRTRYEQIQSDLYDGKIQKLYIPTSGTIPSSSSSLSNNIIGKNNNNNNSFSSKRWISTVLFLQSIHNTEMALKCLAMDDDVREIIGEEELSILISEDVWVKIEILCKIINPIAKWLSYLKHCTERSELFLVPKIFSEIEDGFENAQKLENTDKNSNWKDSVLRELMECVNKRKQLCIHSVHLAAALLDPVHQGSYLNQDQVLQATEFIDSFCELHGYDSAAVVAELSEFRLRVDFYSKPFLWKVTEKLKGSMWWSTMAKKGSDLAQVASAILNISPATFSMDNILHDDENDRINTGYCNKSSSSSSSSFNNSKDCKLIFVTHNLRIRSKVLKNETAKKPRLSTSVSQPPLSPGEIPSRDKTSNGFDFDVSSLEAMYNLSESESEEEQEEEQVEIQVVEESKQEQPSELPQEQKVHLVKIDLNEVTV